MSQAAPLLLSVFVLLQLGVRSAEYETPFGCNGTALHDFFRDIVLTTLNTVRARVARGQYKPYGLPSSSDMNKLRWDCNMESLAERAVQNCPKYAPFSGTPNAINFDYYGPDELATLHPILIMISIKEWTDIEKAVTPSTNVLNKNTVLPKLTNIVTANATAVGCYYYFCNDRASVACVFSQPKTQIGNLVYTPGTPCKTGDSCVKPKTGLCEFGLCLNSA